MVEVRFNMESAVTPERVLAAATDFSARRPELWSGIDPARYEVHAVGDTWADVTEGGTTLGGVWAREQYDWSEPGRVTATVKESNVFQPGSTWDLKVHPSETGGSRIEWTTVRHPKGVKGRVVSIMMRLGGRKFLSQYLEETLAELEDSDAD